MADPSAPRNPRARRAARNSNAACGSQRRCKRSRPPAGQRADEVVRVLRWVILIVVIALIIRYLPEVWQAIQIAIQAVPK